MHQLGRGGLIEFGRPVLVATVDGLRRSWSGWWPDAGEPVQLVVEVAARVVVAMGADVPLSRRPPAASPVVDRSRSL